MTPDQQMPDPASQILNAFTVDVEDYYHVSAFEKQIRRDEWDTFESRVTKNTVRILELLDRFDAKATFFVLGWVAYRRPELVREIHRRGHEIGCHSYWHRLIYQQSPEEFRKDLRDARQVLEDIIGEEVIAYRAPSFGITARSLWALEILAEEGFRIDSSIFPVRHDRYGLPTAPREIHEIQTAAGSLWEFPPSVTKFAGFRVPVGGGGYLRLSSIAWTCHRLSRINDHQQRPFLIYVHPWELDPEQPRLKAASRISRFRHYANLRTTQAKLEQLLQRFPFTPLGEVIRQWSSVDSGQQSEISSRRAASCP
jgi:polysaccharide deacetylase family protein (PEP-CTERM system associated)